MRLADVERSDLSVDVAGVAQQYRADLVNQAARLGNQAWVDVMGAVIGALDRGRLVMVAGNGGSASTANHLAADWRAATRISKRPGRVVSLVENVSRVLALANDVGFDRIFADQVEELAEPGDLLLVLSVSGSSRNLVSAAQVAQRLGADVGGLLGAPGDVIRHVDEAWVCEEKDYGTCEDLQLSFGHCLVRALIGGPQTSVDQVHGWLR